MEPEATIMAKFIGFITALIGGAFGLGKYNATLVKKRELYDPKNGRAIYLTIEKSKENIADCKKSMAKEIDGMTDKLDKIIGHMVKQNDDSKKIAEFIGGVKQYMANNPK